MKKGFYFGMALALAAVLSCVRENKRPDARQEIRFTASVEGDTKATATAFENGDKVTLCAGSPVNEVNVTLSCNGTALVPERPLYWPADMTGNIPVVFRAVFPSVEDATSACRITLPADQYNHPGENDHLGASVSAYPAEDVVNLRFTHLMSRLKIVVEDKVGTFQDTQADHFKCLKVGSVYTSYTLDYPKLEVTADLNVEPGVLFPAKLASNTYSLILPPQSSSPEITVTLSDQTVIFTAPQPISFPKGKQVSAKLTIEKEAVTFSTFIGDDPEAFSVTRMDW